MQRPYIVLVVVSVYVFYLSGIVVAVCNKPPDVIPDIRSNHTEQYQYRYSVFCCCCFFFKKNFVGCQILQSTIICARNRTPNQHLRVL